jgi:hypothetical protein
VDHLPDRRQPVVFLGRFEDHLEAAGEVGEDMAA